MKGELYPTQGSGGRGVKGVKYTCAWRFRGQLWLDGYVSYLSQVWFGRHQNNIFSSIPAPPARLVSMMLSVFFVFSSSPEMPRCLYCIASDRSKMLHRLNHFTSPAVVMLISW